MIAVKNILKDLVVYLKREEIDKLRDQSLDGIMTDITGKIKGELSIKLLNHEIAYVNMKKTFDAEGKKRYSIFLPKEMYLPLSTEGQASTSIYHHDTKGYQIIMLKERSNLHHLEKMRLERIIEKLKK